MLKELKKELRRLADPQQAAVLQRFFKTGPGQYGAGDRFLGLPVTKARTLLPRFRGLPLPDLEKLLDSPWHEERMMAVIILVDRYRKGTDQERQAIFRLVNRKLPSKM